MKTYAGRRDSDGNTHVNVIYGNGKAENLPWRLDLENHSPTGLEWGYGGSGPAQLALAILADVLHAPIRKNRHTWHSDEDDDPRTIAVKLHQSFKWKFIAGLDRDTPWTITEQAVLDFVRDAE